MINCEPTRLSIAGPLKRLYDINFQESLRHVRNPYGEGGASEKVVNAIKNNAVNGITKRAFYDLPACFPRRNK